MRIIATLCLLLCSIKSVFANFAYVANYNSNNISIVDLGNKVTVGYVDNGPFTLLNPAVIAFTPDNSKCYILCQGNNSVFVIDPTLSLVIAQVNAGAFPFSFPTNIAVSPDGTKAYVTNSVGNTVSIIDTATEMVTGYVNPNGFPFNYPFGLSFDGTGAFAGVTNFLGNNASLVISATNTVSKYIDDVGFPANGPRNVALVDDTKGYATEYNAASNAAISIVNVPLQMVTGYVNPNGFPFSNADFIFVSFDLLHAYVQDTTTNQISIIDITTDTVTGYINAVFQNPACFHVSFDNNTLYVVNVSSNSVSVIDLVTNTQIGIIDSSTFPFSNPVFIDLANNIAPPPPPPPMQPTPPTSLQGFKKQNVFASQTELINLITWGSSSGTIDIPVSYLVYRDAALTDLAADILATQPLTFTDHDRRKGHTYTYYVVAVDAQGNFSSPVHVSISR